MLRRVTWRSWAVLAGLLGAYMGLGYWFGGNGTVEEWVYKAGLLAATAAPLGLAAVYTRSGNRWWGNDVGAGVVQAFLILVIAWGVLAWVFWVDHGMLGPGMLAWIEVASPALFAVALLRLSRVFARIDRDGRNGKGTKGEP